MNIAGYIEHTNLQAVATAADIASLCNEAKQYGFFGVCVHPSYITYAKQCLQHTDIRITTVVGFPLGATGAAVKAAETAYAIACGADEVDMTVAIGRVKMGDWDYVADDMRRVVIAAEGRPVKVILETAYLTEKEKKQVCYLAGETGAAFVKTSTGFAPGGATVEDVARMASWAAPALGIKAAGGIRDYKTAMRMIAAGATRLGTSASVRIMEGALHEG
ncbi:deoxyribose-phosphate aldolase [uncultured Megasphaera sp.]|uniref:deoxyribose-phosphate aldolase n=1 Tax=uncultured Megasphaera sp. TaxID=165188 RepID=UPI002584CEE2|nr:deoxyribose-phosphate aldolase [uncultured Megasphaera sp.]